ncbi:uncharacterized protein PHACADRAFT_188077 [Phanerochaete carnosa HHB-10118-sp]|uniref:Uncharacterized protein n=1 Tax=Phanerochaete carnosa (strain HHB-10118-sp) TaxID=650164 RepID=K5VUM0_PHACS|nr:uncharacterized protein PHACADRAFT_188077 [Phanerochaete carnosa HHB-10118-sp]EKM50505.1 hypothetical protein PHACADRAFT_188077 [Phanerochaete carnosa HHB-10118-sp]
MSQTLEYPQLGGEYCELSPMSDISDRTERPRTYEPSSPSEILRSSRHMDLIDDDGEPLAPTYYRPPEYNCHPAGSSGSSPSPTTPCTPMQHAGYSGQRPLMLKPPVTCPPITPSRSRSTISPSVVPAAAYAAYFEILASGNRRQYGRAQEMGYALFPGSTPPNTPSKAVSARTKPRKLLPLSLYGDARSDAVTVPDESDDEVHHVDVEYRDEARGVEEELRTDSFWMEDAILSQEEIFHYEEGIREQDSVEYNLVLCRAIRELLTARPSIRASSSHPSSCDVSDGEEREEQGRHDTGCAVGRGEAKAWQDEVMAQGTSLGEAAFARPRRMKVHRF